MEGPLICASKQGQDIIFKKESNCITLVIFGITSISVFCFFIFLLPLQSEFCSPLTTSWFIIEVSDNIHSDKFKSQSSVLISE